MLALHQSAKKVVIYLTSKDDIVIEVITGAPDVGATGPSGVWGIQVQKEGIATIDSGKNVIITAQSQVEGTQNNIMGIESQMSSRVDIDADGYVYIDSKDEFKSMDSANYGIRANEINSTGNASVIDITSIGKNVDGYGVIIQSSGAESYAAYAQNASFSIDATNAGDGGGIYISADGKKATDAVFVTASNQNSSGRLVADGDIVLSAYNVSTDYAAGIYTNAYGFAATTEVTGKNITVSAVSENSAAYGLYAFNGGGGNTVDVSGNDISVVSNGYKGYSYGVLSTNSDVDITAAGNTNISSTGYGVFAYNNTVSDNNNADVIVNSTGNNNIYGYSTAVAVKGNNTTVDIDSITGVNMITSDITGIDANQGIVDVQGKVNTLMAAIDDNGYGNKHAIKAGNNATVYLNAIAGNNEVAGVVYAKDEGTVVTFDHNITDKNGDIVGKGSGNNIIMSSAHGSEAEGRDHVVAALYAQSNGKIDISAGNGGVNYITTEFNFDADDETEKESERTIWAQQGGKINIEGQTYIIASNADKYTENVAGNARGIAITAGSETIPTEGIDTTNGSIIDIKDELRSHVTLAYNGGSKGLQSFAQGDIVSGYGGIVDVYDTDKSGIFMMGNALAANGGKLNLDIGNGGTWYGRADDYGDAGVVELPDGEKGHTSFFNPAFSNTIVQGGQVNLTMGEGSRWNVTGQSWITSIKTGESDITAGTPIIDLVNANTDRNTTAHALTVYELDGNAIFNMSLNGNRDVSDMLYIKKAEGEYVINVVDAVSVDDMYQNGFDGLRFATIGDGSNVSFRAITYNQGINNVEYEVGQDEYDGNEENNAYNSSKTDGGMSSEKPGSDMVDDFFDSTGTPENPQGPDDTEIMTLENTVESDSNVNGTTNFKLIGVKDSEISDGGKTVVNMSKVNYSNAVYMDRLNKRLGEARYINTEEDQGMWVRMRHDRIGKDNEFRIMNTMYELGYDEKQECDNGERRVGAAIDYMDGSSEYTGVGGSGDVSRKGIWLYDTWLGDKGHYSDFVAKWGHLSNDFTLYRGGDKITGDFSNNVYSISAEYGRKKDIGNNWYFEPQVQLQYARVTDANYTTSQGTEVSLDAINSLIARAGFRLGKDLGERSTVYFKADVLHEFLGDQDIYAHDKTGTMDVTYGNEGTWCDIGFGFATAMSKTSYAYLDVETSLGNDYEETYQINAGLQWSF